MGATHLVEMPDTVERIIESVSGATLETQCTNLGPSVGLLEDPEKKAINFPEIAQTGFPGGSRAGSSLHFGRGQHSLACSLGLARLSSAGSVHAPCPVVLSVTQQ